MCLRLKGKIQLTRLNFVGGGVGSLFWALLAALMAYTGLKKNGKLTGNPLDSRPFSRPISCLPTRIPVFPFFPLFLSISRQKSLCKTCAISSHHKNLI
jgi:hypothetical protein